MTNDEKDFVEMPAINATGKKSAKASPTSKKKNKKTANPSGPKKPRNKRKILNSIIIVFLSLTLISGVTVFFILHSVISEAGNISAADFNSKDSTRLLDNEGNVITTVGAEQRESIKYEKIPQSVIDAFLAIEDSRYFVHNGFDFPRFLKSAFENLSAGNLAQGGSTLTMQMVDNVKFAKMEQTGDPVEKIKRKIQEIWLSMDVENEMTKKDIFEKYLNHINFGVARGIQKASERYFGKDVTQLNLSEAAFLAGIINAPGAYNPYIGYNTTTGVDHYAKGEERRNQTLKLMLQHGYIDEEEYNLAKSSRLAFQLSGDSMQDTEPYQSFIDAVAEEVQEKYGINMYTTPVDVKTTMDIGAQQLSDQMLNGEGITFPANDPNFQTGFSLVNNQNGEILAIGGGRGYTGSDDQRRNRGYKEKMMTGSSIKPLLDYAPAFDTLGWSTSHTISDAPFQYSDGFVIRNANESYAGDVLLDEAIARSLNTTAITALNELVKVLGADGMVDILHNMGFTDVDVNDFSLGYGIGGAGMTATPTEMAAAFSIFANKGNYIEPHTVRSVVRQDGKKVDAPKYDPVNVISEESAYMTSTLLQGAVSSRWANLLQILQSPFPVYAKSGTSDWATDGRKYGIPDVAMRDKWIVAYTSNFTVATWAGYDYDETTLGPNSYITNYKMNVNVPGQIGHKLLNYIHEKYPAQAISRPAGVSDITHVKGKFPYAAPPEGTPADMITTGLIRSKFNKLETLTPDALDSLASFTAKLKDDKSNTVDLTFAPYPNAEKTKTPSHQQTIKSSGGTITGNVFYDPAFLYGEVVYKATAKVDGKVVGEYVFSSENATQSIPIDYGKSAEVCGYYSYKNTDAGKSNEVCATVKRGEKPVEPEKPPVDPEEPEVPPVDPEIPPVVPPTPTRKR